MVSAANKGSLARRPGVQAALVTLVAAGGLAWQAAQVQGFADLWLTRDQQGQRAFDRKEFDRAFELFEDPAWKGAAAYRGGHYDGSAEAFGRVATAEGFFDRGNALMKAGDYRKAISSYELAVDEAPDWTEAQENLALARHTADYIDRMREQSDTDQDEKMRPDQIALDNEDRRGEEVEINRDSLIGLDAADKWMRAVDTDTRDFLRTRFLVEASRRTGGEASRPENRKASPAEGEEASEAGREGAP